MGVLPWWVVPALVGWVVVLAGIVLVTTREDSMSMRQLIAQLPPFVVDVAERAIGAFVTGAAVALLSGERGWPALGWAGAAGVASLIVRGGVARRVGDPGSASLRPSPPPGPPSL